MTSSATLRSAPFSYVRRHVPIGFSNTSRAGASGIGMQRLRIEEHVVDPRREETSIRTGHVPAGAADFGFHTPGMRAEQQNAGAEHNCFGNRMRHEQDRDAR